MRLRLAATRQRVLIVALLMAMALTACRGGDDDAANDVGSGPKPTQVPVATETPTSTVEDQVLTAYTGYLEAYKNAVLNLDPSVMDGFASGEELQRIRGELDTMRSQGLALRLVVTHKPVVIEQSQNSAVLLDVMVNNSFFVDARTKEPPVASGSGEMLRHTFYLEKTGDRWLVVRSIRQR